MSKISAKQFIMVNRATGEQIIGKNELLMRECASLTKIMTFYLSCQLCDKLNIDPSLTYFQISKKAARMIGTTANLVRDTWVTLQDLFYGMMLPSGNDSALAVAENLGLVYKLGY